MTYVSIQRKKNYKKVKDRILNLYLNCSTWEEFKVKASLNVPEARWRDLLACKLHWLKKSYPVAYRFLWLAIPTFLWSLSFAFFCLIEGMTKDSVAYSIMVSAPLYMFILFFHLAFVGDFMKEIQWYEDGCPIEL